MKPTILIFMGLLLGEAAWAAEKTDNSTVEPGKVHEICMRLEFGKRLSYAFVSSRELSFNIHYHEGETVRFPVEEHSSDDETEIFTAQLTQDYCMMWTNANDRPARLNVIYQVR